MDSVVAVMYALTLACKLYRIVIFLTLFQLFTVSKYFFQIEDDF